MTVREGHGVRPCLLLMLRSPRLGRVKTRLARDVGDATALALYKAFVEDELAALTGCGADVAVFVEPGKDIPMVRQWLEGHQAPDAHTAEEGGIETPRGRQSADSSGSPAAARPSGQYQYVAQCEGDLGSRLDHAFRWAFGQGYASAAALGSDLPGLTPSLARMLARFARTEPALIGKCPDGGYWTIGFAASRYLPEVFRNIPWSTPEVYSLTELILAPLEPAHLPELSDVDTLPDLQGLLASLPSHAAPLTRAGLQAGEAAGTLNRAR